MTFSDDVYLNFHAHQQMPAEKEIVIQSLFLQNDLIIPSSDKIFFTAGLHPWHADKLNDESIEKRLRKLITDNRIVAVGEIGIDKLKGPGLDIQREVFRNQVEIAKEHNLPVIVHSVKAHDEVLKLKLESKSNRSWVIHHFNGSKQMAFDLLNHGFYLSLSHHINNTKSRLNSYLTNLPLDRIFLETDDFDIDIKLLYRLLAGKLKLSESKLKKQLIENLKSFLDEQ